jgi:hypothetical protein
MRNAAAAVGTLALFAVLCAVGAFDAQRAASVPRLADVSTPSEPGWIEGAVARPDGSPVEGAHVRVAVNPGSREGNSAFPLDAFVATTSADGSFRVQASTIRFLEVEGADGLAPPGITVGRPGGARVLLRLHEPVDARILVVDEAGKPSVGTIVVVERTRSLPTALPPLVSARQVTDSQGVAVVPGLNPVVAHRLTLTPDEKTLADWPFDDERWLPRDERIVLERKLEIHGRVLDADGDPVEKAVVTLLPKPEKPAPADPFRSRQDVDLDSTVLVSEVNVFSFVPELPRFTDSDGRFTIGPLRKGYVDVRLAPPFAQNASEFFGKEFRPSSGPIAVFLPFSDSTDATPFTLRAGATDAVLLLDRPKEIRVHVDGWRPGQDSSVTLLPEFDSKRPGVTFFPMRADVADDGTAVFPYPRREPTFTLWRKPDSNGWFILRTGIRAVASPIHVALTQGKPLRGRVRGTMPKDSVVTATSVDRSDLEATGVLRPDGTFVFTGLPDGRWRILVGPIGDDASPHAAGTANAGQDVELTFFDPPRAR